MVCIVVYSVQTVFASDMNILESIKDSMRYHDHAHSCMYHEIQVRMVHDMYYWQIFAAMNLHVGYIM